VALGDWAPHVPAPRPDREGHAADVQRVAAAYLKPATARRFFLPTEKPDRATIPQLASVERWSGTTPDAAVVQAGEVFEASPPTSSRAPAHALPMECSSRCCRENAWRQCVCQLVVRYGDLNSLTNKATVSSLTGDALSRHVALIGTAEGLVDKLKARPSVGGGGTT